MSVLSIAKNKPIREAFKTIFTPLVTNETIKKIFKTDQVISNPRLELPSVAVYLDEGEQVDPEFMDDLDVLLVKTSVVIKFMADTSGSSDGDDAVDLIAEAGLNLLNSDLTLGGLLNADLDIEDFIYERDPNQLYTALMFRSNIEFYDK